LASEVIDDSPVGMAEGEQDAERVVFAVVGISVARPPVVEASQCRRPGQLWKRDADFAGEKPGTHVLSVVVSILIRSLDVGVPHLRNLAGIVVDFVDPMPAETGRFPVAVGKAGPMKSGVGVEPQPIEIERVIFYTVVDGVDAAGQAEGLPEDLARKLASETLIGSGALFESRQQTPSSIRADVTSSGGTTAAALDVMMGNGAFAEMIRNAVSASTRRSIHLRNSG